MANRELQIINKLGLHARAAAKFVSTSASFSNTKIEVEKNGKRVNGKSIMGIMMLAAAKGSRIDVYAEGDDESAALDALEALLGNYFGEGE